MGTQFWEPWTPKIGDRVRIKVSGECTFSHLGNAKLTKDYTLLDAIVDGNLGGPGFQGANGVVGTVVGVYPSEDEDDGHPYYVNDACGGKWDRVDDFFAAIELEPVQ